MKPTQAGIGGITRMTLVEQVERKDGDNNKVCF
jgi:hypothetical protein